MAPVVTRKRISYVLPLDSERDGHRLGVNGLAYDHNHSILFSAGRDGVLRAWDVQFGPNSPKTPAVNGQNGKPSNINCLRQVQAHTHWINDFCQIKSKAALVSASSDLSVKVWRPYAETTEPPHTLGLHTDYVKRAAVPKDHADWVAAGGLDRRVTLWDINGAGKRLQFDVADEDAPTKGSVYALACNETLIATGGPESLVKLWDPRSEKRITKFVGHTDNVRDILISHDNDTILTASSDKTVKLWSLTAGRCIHTFGMHKDSVWCLASDDPYLSIFYSGDRSGIVSKTDTRNINGADDGLSVAIAQEHDGINNIVTGGGAIWTATGSSSINSWQDADLSVGVRIPENLKSLRLAAGHRSRGSVVTLPRPQSPPVEDDKHKLPYTCVLRLSNMTGFPSMRSGAAGGRLSTFSGPAARKGSVAAINTEAVGFAPLRSAPSRTIEGQDGLIKHVVLSDKQRALTSDTTGNVVMWDLLRCVQIKSFGKQDIDRVASDHMEQTSISRWCNVDTRTGTLTCTLDQQHGFDAEVYWDDTQFALGMDYREDQRINLGRWILRHLFAALLDEEIRRDQDFRSRLMPESTTSRDVTRPRPAMTLDIPSRPSNPFHHATSPESQLANGDRNALMSPGLAIGVATPTSGLSPTSSTAAPFTPAPLGSVLSDNARASTEGRSSDYFSQPPTSQPPPSSSHSSTTDSKTPKTPSETSEEKAVTSPTETAKAPGTPGRFGKFFSTLNKTGKKLNPRSQPDDSKTSTSASDQDAQGSAEGSNAKEEPPTTFGQYVQQARRAYVDAINKETDASQVALPIVQSSPNELPDLVLPHGITVIIQEESADTHGAADLFEGKIEDLGLQADLIEAVAPPWLAEVLLKNRVPPQAHDYNKVKFLLEPADNLLPWICKPDRTEHLNANRMLRARKMATYVADKLEPPDPNVEPDPDAIRADAYIDLYCNNQLLAPKTTLAWMKSHIWRGGGEMVIQYRANGKKRIVPTGTDLIYVGQAAEERKQ